MRLIVNKPGRFIHLFCGGLLLLIFVTGCGNRQHKSLEARDHYDSLITSLSSADSSENARALQQVNHDLSNNSAAIAPYTGLIAQQLIKLIADDRMVQPAMYTLLALKERGVVFSLGIATTNVLLRHAGNMHSLALSAYQRNNAIWDNDDYLAYREDLGAITDLLGRGEPELTDSLLLVLQDFPDARVAAFAVSAILEQHKEPDAGNIRRIAANIESRETLFAILQAHKRPELFPENYRVQDSLTLSVMVNWLTYPTELGRTPDAISIVTAAEKDFQESGSSFIYLIKFRSGADGWKEKGWMAGIAGPFAKKDTPTVEAFGYTFSKFEPLDEKHPEAQLDSLISFVRQNWENTP